jgi:hypothetical protein
MRLATLAVAGCLVVIRTAAASELMEAAYQPEVYSRQGQTIGCGISYNVAWTNAEKQVVGITGSVTVFYPQAKNLFASVKAAGLMNMARTPVTYAWASTAQYGKTTDFKPAEADDPGAYLAVKYDDPKTANLPSSIAHLGGTIGVTFAKTRREEAVDVPAAPAEAAAKIDACLSELTERVRRDMPAQP